jgi:two-component system NarL family sensor kinase
MEAPRLVPDPAVVPAAGAMTPFSQPADNDTARSKRLVAQLLSAEERARRELGQSLHDGPLQDLAAVQLALGRVRDGDPNAISAARETLAQTIRQLRHVVFDLYPPALEELGLEIALGNLAEEIRSRSGIAVSLTVAPAANGAHDQLAFSLVRELLSNVERHAHASTVAISLGRVDGELVMIVRDNGIGIDPDRLEIARRAGHIGLASSIERVEALGGTFAIGRDDGTLVRATLPARRMSDVVHPAFTRGNRRTDHAHSHERRSIAL